MVNLVPASEVATKLGLALPLAPSVEERIDLAISESQDKVEAYLRRPLVATTRTVTGLWATPGVPLDSSEAWPAAIGILDDRFRVASTVVSVTEPGAFDVTFLVGLDVAGDPALKPIKTYIRGDAVADLIADPMFTAVHRVVKSVSAGGQSVTFEPAERAAGAVGARMTIESLKQWRRLSIGQPASHALSPWPYVGRW